MNEPLEAKFKDLVNYSKYKVSMDYMSIIHTESEEIYKVNQMFEKLDERVEEQDEE